MKGRPGSVSSSVAASLARERSFPRSVITRVPSWFERNGEKRYGGSVSCKRRNPDRNPLAWFPLSRRERGPGGEDERERVDEAATKESASSNPKYDVS